MFKIGDLVIPTINNSYVFTGKACSLPMKVVEVNQYRIVVEISPEDSAKMKLNPNSQYPVNPDDFKLAVPEMNEQKLKKALGL